jgi:hypothetical protein
MRTITSNSIMIAKSIHIAITTITMFAFNGIIFWIKVLTYNTPFLKILD